MFARDGGADLPDVDMLAEATDVDLVNFVEKQR